ncbi:MAG: sigma 54-interacting transcriptional regulator [Thermodesulforhabdaceae bacterium]
MVSRRECMVLITCQDSDLHNYLVTLLSAGNYTTITAQTIDSAIKIIERQKIHAAIVEESIGNRSSLEVLEYRQRFGFSFPVLVISKEPSVEKAKKIIKLGAYDYFDVSFIKNSGVIVQSLKEALSQELAIDSSDSVKEAQSEEGETGASLCRFEGLVGTSAPMRKLYRLIDRVAQADVTVLITGESGTGKELVAEAIHRRSNRRSKPFVPVNCGAIPEELLESEFFGHEKGAFSGAIRTKIGRFELANGGSIFLDEIGEMKTSLQVKLLRFLQERTFERVGGLKTIEVDVRVIAATNKDLWKAVQEGTFREDLFYRLNVVPIHVPPLRERKEDIPLLIEHFLERHALSSNNGERKRLKPDVIECFMEYPWPGNVRELENIIKRLIILSDGDEITIDDLPDRFRQNIKTKTPDVPLARLPEEGLDLKKTLEDIERSLIQQALERTGGVKNQAAKLLGLNRTTLIEKMKKLKMDLSYGSKT